MAFDFQKIKFFEVSGGRLAGLLKFMVVHKNWVVAPKMTHSNVKELRGSQKKRCDF